MVGEAYSALMIFYTHNLAWLASLYQIFLRFVLQHLGLALKLLRNIELFHTLLFRDVALSRTIEDYD